MGGHRCRPRGASPNGVASCCPKGRLGFQTRRDRGLAAPPWSGPSVRTDSYHRPAVSLCRSSRGRHVRKFDEDRPWSDQPATWRKLWLGGPAYLGSLRSGRQLFRAARRSGRLVRQRKFHRSIGALAARRICCASFARRIRGQEFSPPHRPLARSEPVIDGTPLLKFYARRRGAALQREDAVLEQEGQLLKLVRRAEHTRFGRDHAFGEIKTMAD